MNIAANAVDYTPEGGNPCGRPVHRFRPPSCRIRQRKRVLAGSAEKSDTAFYTEDKSRHSAGHHGMGLTFAHHVVHLHHGELILENQESGGARAEIRIPLEGVRQNKPCTYEGLFSVSMFL